jgi:hypothetical protein
MSNCPEQIRVYFDIVTRTGDDGINPDDVDRMHLFVFSKGYYLGEYIDNSIEHFSPDYYIDCSDLLPGKYQFIAWGGEDDNCFSTSPVPFEKGRTHIDDALLSLKHSNDMVSGRIHHLFHSDLAATVTNEKVQRFLMPLVQLTNTINIRTVGLPADGNNYTFDIADNNCNYLFDGSFLACRRYDDFIYTEPCGKDGAYQLHSTLNVMRLAADRHEPQLKIVNETSGTLLYPTGSQSGDLIDLIRRANPQNDFDTTHIYDIVLNFKPGGGDGEPTGFTVTLLINGWEVREQNGDLID